MKPVRQEKTHILECHCGSRSFNVHFVGALWDPDQMMVTCTKCGDRLLIDHVEPDPEWDDVQEW